MALSGVVGAIYKASGDPVAFTQKPMTKEATSSGKRFFITDRTMQYWNNKKPVTIEKSTDGTTWTIVTSGFVMEHVGGYIEFPADQTTTQYRASGEYLTVNPVGGGYNWSLDIEADTLEATTFLNNGWKTYLPATRGFSGSFEHYWADSSMLADVGNESVIIVLYVDVTTSKTRYEGYATITTNNIETPNDDLITETCDFSGADRIYYRVGS